MMFDIWFGFLRKHLAIFNQTKHQAWGIVWGWGNQTWCVITRPVSKENDNCEIHLCLLSKEPRDSFFYGVGQNCELEEGHCHETSVNHFVETDFL